MSPPTNSAAAKLLREWWEHRGSLAISLLVTLFALGVYFATFLGERPMPVFDSIDRLELNTLDVRFQLRGRVAPDPRIIIVDIDQRSQEQLGRWPFPRIHFAHALDALREDGAKVVAFDITFSKPDQTVNAVGRQPAAPTGVIQQVPARPYCAAAQASRSSFFITLPLALRGSGSEINAIVSGTL